MIAAKLITVQVKCISLGSIMIPENMKLRLQATATITIFTFNSMLKTMLMLCAIALPSLPTTKAVNI
ncbi:hypothetical protein D3C78_1023830 [compost metagenome]